jgi:glycosyltransferase involved in cell wall biosynthesis
VKVAIDLRLLNYKHLTGVGIYTLYLLKQLQLIKQTDSQLQIIAIGLKPEIFDKLSQEYSFLETLFDQKLSLNDYLNTRFNIDSKLVNLYLLFRFRFLKTPEKPQIRHFDYLILPQPRLILKHPDTKIISIFHDIYSVLYRQNLSFVQKILENKFNYNTVVKMSYQVWGNSITTCRDIQSNLLVDKSKIQFVYPGVPNLLDLTTHSPQTLDQKLLSSKPFVLAISGIEPRKNWYNLLLAHKYLQQSYSDYNLDLVLAGRIVNQKYYDSLLRLITKMNIQNVTWYFDVDENQKQELLESCEIFVYPSLYEGFGFPILEAFKYSKPVITSRVSSMPEIAKDSAMYVNPLNFYDIARAIYVLYKDDWLKSQLTKNTNIRLKEFSWNELYNKLEKLVGQN